MFESIKTFLRHMLTEVDNQTYEIGRVLWAVAVILGLILTVASFLTGKPFNLEQFGIGTGTILGAGGVATALKAHVEGVIQKQGNDQ